MTSVRRLRARFAAALLVAVCVFLNTPCVATETAPNTTISNTSSATYQDSNSNAYSANSNTVSIVVQNAPSLTITPGTNQTVAPGQTVTDTYTVTNTGNAAGTVQLTAAATIAGSDSGSTTVTYSYSGTGYATYTTLNTALNSVSVPVNGTILISVVYALASTATTPGTVTTDITGTIAYAAVGSAPAETSSAVTATAESDAVTADARLDLELTSSQNGGTGAITYTLTAQDGTATWAAKDLTAVKDLLSAGTAGVFISTKIPQYPAGTPLTVTGTASTATSAGNGFATGATAAIYYTTSTTGASGWTLASGGTIPAGAFYIGVFVSGGSCTVNGSSMSGVEVCPLASPTSSAGNVTAAAITLTYTVTQSAASGSANTGSTTAIGNSLIGDNAATEHVIGPGITLNSLADGSDTATITTSGEGINNTTSENSPSGASQITSNCSLAAYLVVNGPFGNPAATGAYDGSSNDSTHDFTAVSFLKAGNTYTTSNTTASYTPTTPTTTSAAVTGINVESTLQNTGNKDDTYTVVATAPSGGWTVQLFADSSGSPGAALGGATSGATSTASSVAIASGVTLNYWAVYAAPSGVTYLSHGVATVVATSVALGTVSNQTNHLLYAGFVAITTTATTTTGCPAGISPSIVVGTVCPGGTINYTIDYRNIVATTDVSSVPAVSFARVSTKAGTLVITADGTNTTVTPSNWATSTNGPTVAPADTTSGTTFAYFNGATGGTSVGSTFQTGLTKFEATTGGATFQLVPLGYGSGTAQGTITFAVIVK